jgi:hypothetical protein
MGEYVLPTDALGYEAGTVLRDVTLKEARDMSCNMCGDCCDGSREDVKKDEATGLPLQVWGSKFPADLYAHRYGTALLQPIVMVDGGIDVGESFDVDVDGKPHTSFRCSQLRDIGDGKAACGLMVDNPLPDGSPPNTRPYNCGSFPVFGQEVDDSVIDGNAFVPPTGALPRCTWHGLRIVGPYQDKPYWIDRWVKQQRGEEVFDLSLTDERLEKLGMPNIAELAEKNRLRKEGLYDKDAQYQKEASNGPGL